MEFGDFNSSNYQKNLAKDTNINLVFTTATMQTANEKFGLMLASQGYTDLMQYNQQVYRMVRTDTGAMWASSRFTASRRLPGRG